MERPSKQGHLLSSLGIPQPALARSQLYAARFHTITLVTQLFNQTAQSVDPQQLQ